VFHEPGKGCSQRSLPIPRPAIGRYAATVRSAHSLAFSAEAQLRLSRAVAVDKTDGGIRGRDDGRPDRIGPNTRRSPERAPLTATAPQQGIGCRWPSGPCRIEFKRDGRIVLPQTEDRLHNGPSGFDTVGSIEQGLVADHTVVNQCFVAGAGRGSEIISISEIHFDAAELYLRSWKLCAKLQ
jgi:hypothetical protein